MRLQDPTPPEEVMLFSDGLLSKWGFSDGGLLDWLFEFIRDCDTHKVLAETVKRYLVPNLDCDVELIEIWTCHNPIRAKSINRVGVEGLWFDPEAGHDDLSPSFVTVSGEEVLKLARELNLPINQKR